MKTQVKHLATGLSVIFGIFLLAQCTSNRSDGELSEKHHDFKKEVKKEYAEVKEDVKEVFTSDKNEGAQQTDPRWDEQPKAKDKKADLKDEFADINQEFVEAFEALGENMQQDVDHTQQKMAAARLERISKRLDSRVDKLEDRLKAENKAWEAADELAQLRVVQTELDMQITKVKNASHSNWDKVRKDTRKTCKAANDEIAVQVDEIQSILASK